MRIDWEPGGITDFMEVHVTSEGPEAQVLEDKYNTRICLTGEEVRWLHEQLGELIKAQDAEDPANA